MSLERCDTTLTPRHPRTDCGCDTYPDNLGPCETYLLGANGQCVYCDHEENCHPLDMQYAAAFDPNFDHPPSSGKQK